MTPDQSVLLQNGVSSILIHQKINLEFRPNGPLYHTAVLFLSLVAMVKNLSGALFTKISGRREGSIRRILWRMGRSATHTSSFPVDGLSALCHEIKVKAATWKALDICYNYGKYRPQNSDLRSRLTNYWLQNLENRQAITNRKKITVEILTEVFEDLSVKTKEIKLVSFACGSAQSIIEAIVKCQHQNIKAILIDIDRGALDEAKRRVVKAGMENSFSVIRGTTKALERVCRDSSPHIVEMIGYLDYLDNSKAAELISQIYELLPQGGIFITCNIARNREKILLDWVFLWPMVYRSQTELADLLIEGGFLPENIQLFYEPLKIHGIALCKK